MTSSPRTTCTLHDEPEIRDPPRITAPSTILAPIGSQEVWAAGVTYFRSRSARMEESKDAGGGNFYDRVYSAERPELFFKATAHASSAPARRAHPQRRQVVRSRAGTDAADQSLAARSSATPSATT